MPNRNKKAERAKQFLPFDALKGFREALKAKERVIVKKRQLSEDDYEVLNRRIQQIQSGGLIKITYYDQSNYVEVHGMVLKVDLEYSKTIQIVDTLIPIKDIIDISGESIND